MFHPASPVSPADYVPTDQVLKALASKKERVKRAIFTSLEVIPQPLLEALRLEVCYQLETRIKNVQAGRPSQGTPEEDERFLSHSEQLEKLTKEIVVPTSVEEDLDDGSLELYTMTTSLETAPGVYEEMVVAVELVQLTPGGEIMDRYRVFFNVDLLRGGIALDTNRFRTMVQDGREYS